jgi:uncharacterized membrane protein YbhN (UPF0104 family)
MLANAIPLTPGGLGVGEVAFDRLFVMAGFAGGSLLILTWRLAMLPVCLVGALLYVLGSQRQIQFSWSQDESSDLVTKDVPISLHH